MIPILKLRLRIKVQKISKDPAEFGTLVEHSGGVTTDACTKVYASFKECEHDALAAIEAGDQDLFSQRILQSPSPYSCSLGVLFAAKLNWCTALRSLPPGARPGSIRSRRCAMNDQARVAALSARRGGAPIRAGRHDGRGPERGVARALGGPIGGADRAVRRRKVDASASGGPLGAARRRRSADRGRRDLDDERRQADARSGARTSASSTSSIICCRSSPRSRTSSCRR